ncbi:MAG TPA: ABC transporter permease subunit [Thermoplasmata archaeon]|nr:ABC transporter permease subunit [Thermoplasmata archaeon]
MRLSQAWTVARHDMQLLRQRRGILVGLVAFPVGIGVGFPALIQFLLLPRGGPDPATWAPMFIDAFAFWFVIGAASLPTSIASYSIVGEKVSKSLEPLLATPTTDGEILLGKTLAALVPTLLAMSVGATLFQVLIDLETVGPFGYLYYPNWQMAVELFIAMPLVALTAVEASVVISSRVTDTRSAQQYAGVILVPMIFVYVAAEIVLTLTAINLLYISAAFGLLALLLFWVSVNAFRREEILTRWK